MAILSVTEARGLLPGIPATVEDTALTTFVARVQSKLSAHLGYAAHEAGGEPDLEDQTRTFFLAPNEWVHDKHRRELQLPEFPIVSITSIEEDPDEAFDGSSYLVASTDYDAANATLKNEGIIRLEVNSTHGSWMRSDCKVIKVVGVLGWATVPAVVKHAGALMVTHWWKQRATYGDISVSTGEVTAAIRTAMPMVTEEAKELVKEYRVPRALV